MDLCGAGETWEMGFVDGEEGELFARIAMALRMVGRADGALDLDSASERTSPRTGG